MATNVVVPELGESVVEATVGEWSVKVGDAVSVGDLLVELQTDKVDLEVTADVAGTVSEIIKGEDEDVEIGETLAVIDEADGGSAPAATPAAEMPGNEPTETSQVEPQGKKTITESSRSVASPVARRIAAEQGINLDDLSGTGRGGRVMKADVMNSRSSETPAPTASPSAEAGKAVASKPVAKPTPSKPSVQESDSGASALAQIFGNEEGRARPISLHAAHHLHAGDSTTASSAPRPHRSARGSFRRR